MAAKENQGLQAIVIVLTIFLLLTGVGLLLVNNARKTAVARAGDLDQQAKQARDAAGTAQGEANAYKQWIGFAEEDAYEALQKFYAEDQARFGASMEEQTRKYRTMLDNIFEENRKLVQNEANAKQQVKELNDRLLAVEAQKEEQVKAFQAQLEQMKTDLASERQKFEENRAVTLAEKEKLAADVQALQTAHDTVMAELNSEKTSLETTVIKQQNSIQELNRIRDETGPNPDKFAQPADGRITWVNQRYGKVWIDLGSADGLRPQVTFSVVAAGNADAEAAAKKGSIEVVRILDDHMAEAQITSDEPTNPLLPGDQIYSQVWDRGREIGFAIAGFIDLDKDGQSDLEQLKNIITANNGRIDAAPDETGNKQGEMKVDTRYLVLGELPEGTRQGELRQSWIELGEEAANLGIDSIALDQFVRLMGWQVNARSVSFGVDSRAEDFPPLPPTQDMPRKPVQPAGAFERRLPGVSY